MWVVDTNVHEGIVPGVFPVDEEKSLNNGSDRGCGCTGGSR